MGSADTVRRQALVSRWMEDGTADTKVLDVASGWPFLTFVRDNWPELDCTAVELSRTTSTPCARATRGSRTCDVPRSPLKLVEANCEKMPFEDASFDAVTNVYLFHEMPKEARRNAAGSSRGAEARW